MTTININGIDKDILLEELWKKSKPAPFFTKNKLNSPKFDLHTAKNQLRGSYADYICGRYIKTDIYHSDDVYPYMYDRENGNGAFEEVVNSLRYNKQISQYDS